ncbi:5-dehydro-4-deoxyglucarate dehydratase [Rubripirellula amarantea]|uniref:5-dehydro-4-deoxyglucarate dehydratase n=1 Tax=Rubripirellula amarantea TaxID=2527999 RepID=A0A5C5WXE3_9BACT|nr:dihydrodipicolinate synthase family protein [Rubripirellula amarantea]TWT54542.1 5-dehydro-4-deoxyglucarate dehydratase [Rubripirellula amarantea]
MDSSEFQPAQLRQSVIAVPPMARDTNGNIDVQENEKVIRFLEAGGVRSLLYGGNAVFYHISLAEYSGTLQWLSESTSDDTVVIPSIGPAYGFARDQVEVLQQFNFPTAMLLPSRDVVDQQGIATSIRRLAEDLGKPLVVYLKFDRWLDASLIRSLEDDGVISWIKYAVVREDTSNDDYLREVIDAFPSTRIVSGIGEQPAIIHLRDFGITGFTSGCICVAPERSMEMMHAIHAGDYEKAEAIRKWFCPLEDLRNEINPIRVLHHAVEAAGIAKMGPLQPMLSDLDDSSIERIRAAVSQMA